MHNWIVDDDFVEHLNPYHIPSHNHQDVIIAFFMQACQFYGFSGFVLEKGKDPNLARLASVEDWVRQVQEEELEDDEVFIFG